MALNCTYLYHRLLMKSYHILFNADRGGVTKCFRRYLWMVSLVEYASVPERGSFRSEVGVDLAAGGRGWRAADPPTGVQFNRHLSTGVS